MPELALNRLVSLFWLASWKNDDLICLKFCVYKLNLKHLKKSKFETKVKFLPLKNNRILLFCTRQLLF